MTTPAEINTCCAASYGSDAVALLLGESYHPGGLALTRRLAERLRLGTGVQTLDVASGPGTTARLLAEEFGAEVDGVDLGEQSVERARAAAEESGLADRVRFHVGDAERLPVPGAAFDAVVCECAFCTFPDKATAARDFARVLRPGGRVGITDVTLTEGALPEELTGLAAWVACIADARPLEGYAAILAGARLSTVYTERHDDALTQMIDQIEARIRVLRMTAPGQLATAGVDVDAVLRYTKLAKQAVEDGLVGYALLIAEKDS